MTVQDEARLRQGHKDQSRQGHQCSKTTLTGESRFHKCNPLGIEPESLMTGSKWVDHWTSGTVFEGSEIAGYSHTPIKTNTMPSDHFVETLKLNQPKMSEKGKRSYINLS